MIQVQSEEEGNNQIYSLLFYRNKFIFIGGINIEDLKYFSITNQNKLGKIKIKFNIKLLHKILPLNNINYIIMTKYQQILIFPYLLRKQNQNIHILTTKFLYQIAKIYLKDFYNNIKKVDQIINKLSYQQQTLIYDNYQQQYGLYLQEWLQLYSKNQIQNCFSKFICLNYGQIYDTQKGITITPYPSGYGLGSAVWLFQNKRYNNKLLWINDMFHHNWRACQQFNIGNLHKQINTIIFTKNSLNITQQRVDQYQCINFFTNIKKKLKENKNSTIVIDDMLYFCDFINYISWQLKDKINKIFISSQSTTKIITYANSYVDFLSEKHSKRIYQDPPKYPFQNYFHYKKNKILFQGTLQQIAQKNKIPTKYLVQKSTPYLHFIQDFHAYLFYNNQQKKDILFTPKTSIKKLKQFFNKIKYNKIYIYENNFGQLQQLKKIIEYQSIKIGQKFIQKQNYMQKIYISQGQCNKIVSCVRYNDFVILQKFNQQLRLLDKNWINILIKQLRQRQIHVQSQSQNKIKTNCSSIQLKNYQIFLSSTNINEVYLLSNLLTNLTIKIKPK